MSARRNQPKTGKQGTGSKKDSKLATSHRRHGGWRSIRAQRASSWDAAEVSKRMERVLQPAPREGEAERIQEKKRRTSERTTRLARLYHNEDFQLLWKALQSWEAMSYDDLTKVTTRKDQVSIEYYVGFMNGRIAVISDIKDLFTRSVIAHKKDEAAAE